MPLLEPRLKGGVRQRARRADEKKKDKLAKEDRVIPDDVIEDMQKGVKRPMSPAASTDTSRKAKTDFRQLSMGERGKRQLSPSQSAPAQGKMKKEKADPTPGDVDNYRSFVTSLFLNNKHSAKGTQQVSYYSGKTRAQGVDDIARAEKAAPSLAISTETH